MIAGARFGRAEKLFLALSLVIFSGSLDIFLVKEDAGMNKGTVESDGSTTAIYLAVYAVSLGLAAARRAEFRDVLLANKRLILLSVLPLASALWSDSPTPTVRIGIALILTLSFSIYLSLKELGDGEFLALVGTAVGTCTVASLLVGLLLPGYGVMGGIHEGAWRGIFITKNNFGRYMVLSALVLKTLAVRDRRPHPIPWAGMGLAVLLILLSRSMTSLVILTLLLSLVPLLRVVRQGHSTARFCLLLVVGLCIAAGAFLAEAGDGSGDRMARAVERDATLTGRMPLWELVLEKVWDRPWLGYGYGAFWAEDAPQSAYIYAVLGWEPPHAHNGFLQIMLDLGLLGLAALLYNFACDAVNAIKFALRRSDGQAVFPLSCILFLFLSNLTECSFLAKNHILWILYLSLSVRMQRTVAGGPHAAAGLTLPGVARRA